MIYLFTDFGWRGPYTGEMTAVLQREAPGTPVIPLLADAPAFRPMAAAHLLAAVARNLRVGDVLLGVVDPGVGTSKRRPIVLEIAGRYFVGPDNGLFSVVAHRAERYSLYEITWQPGYLSDSFHGRDLFAPIAARLALGGGLDDKLVPLPALAVTSRQDDLFEIIYVDGFGNAMTGIRSELLDPGHVIRVGRQILHYARTFASVSEGEPFWYRNSIGLVELAINCGNASQALDLAVGTTVTVGENVSRLV